MSRRKGREFAFQILFQHDLSESDASEGEMLFWKCHPASEEARTFASFLFRKAVENQEAITELIQKRTQHWRIERMSAVDRNILRVAVAEILYVETPRAVVIDEAIEIARKFGSEKSPEFVNGILDAVANEIERSRK